MNKTTQMPKKPLDAAKPQPQEKQVFMLEVTIISGPMTESFAKKNPVISRTFEARGDHTLADLHHAIFKAFGRYDAHMYEFQVGGKRPMDPKARRFGPSMAMVDPFGERDGSADAARTTIASLRLASGKQFGYWFDFGDDWWHQINVLAIAAGVVRGKLPKATQRVGASPPQYVDWDEEE